MSSRPFQLRCTVQDGKAKCVSTLSDAEIRNEQELNISPEDMSHTVTTGTVCLRNTNWCMTNQIIKTFEHSDVCAHELRILRHLDNCSFVPNLVAHLKFKLVIQPAFSQYTNLEDAIKDPQRVKKRNFRTFLNERLKTTYDELHTKWKVIHGDLKPANIVLNSAVSFGPIPFKLVDFERAIILGDRYSYNRTSTLDGGLFASKERREYDASSVSAADFDKQMNRWEEEELTTMISKIKTFCTNPNEYVKFKAIQWDLIPSDSNNHDNVYKV